MLLVLLGKWQQWPGFSDNSGYWGTHFLDSLLYSMGNADEAVKLVAAIWFMYGAAIGGAVTAVIVRLSADTTRRGPPDAP